MLQNFLHNLPMLKTKKGPGEQRSPVCPQCNYPLDRPHAFFCARCQAEIPQARGCNGCGRCQQK